MDNLQCSYSSLGNSQVKFAPVCLVLSLPPVIYSFRPAASTTDFLVKTTLKGGAGINEMSSRMGSKGAMSSLGLMSILKCHVTIHVGVLIVLTLGRLLAITFQHDTMCLPNHREPRPPCNAFIFFQWLVIPLSGPFSLIGYVSSLLSLSRQFFKLCTGEGGWAKFKIVWSLMDG